MAKRQHNGPARDRRQLLELLAVHAVIIAVLLALTGIVLHKAFTPVTAENTTRQLVAFDRWERERHGDLTLLVGETRYRITFNEEAVDPVLDSCGTGVQYEVYARHVNASDGPDYERVFALIGEDGTAYLTFEEASADERRQGMTAAACMGGALVMYLVGAVRHLRRSGLLARVISSGQPHRIRKEAAVPAHSAGKDETGC